MPLEALIDASVLVEIERGGLELSTVLERQADIDVAIAAVTASELLHGVHRAPQGKRRVRREAFVEHLLGRLPVVPFDLVLQLGFTPDSGRSYAVATHDTRSFRGIPGVTLLAWRMPRRRFRELCFRLRGYSARPDALIRAAEGT